MLYRDVTVFQWKEKKKKFKNSWKAHSDGMKWIGFFESQLCLRNCTLNGVAFVCVSNMPLYSGKKEYKEDSSINVFACQFFLVNDVTFWHKTNTIPGIIFANFPTKNDYGQFYGPKNQFICFRMRHVHLIVGLLLWRISFKFCYWTSFHFDFFFFSFLISFFLTNVLFHCFFAQNSFALIALQNVTICTDI